MHKASALAATLLLSTPCLPLSAEENQGGHRMEGRTVPIPAGVSAEMQKIIADREVPPPLPVPETREGWLKFQREADAAMAEDTRVAVKRSGATYQAMTVAGVPCFLVTPKRIDSRYADRWLVHIHGGAFVLGGGEAAVREAIWVAEACGAQVLSIDYRRPPEHPFPAAIDDTVAVWKAILERQDAAGTALFGSSAGGNLTLATTLKLKQLGLPTPGALFVGTPAVDLEKTGDTWYTVEGLDPLGRYQGGIRGCFEAYVPSKDFSDPLVSPIRGEMKGFPPTILISGTRDLLLSDTVRIHRAMRLAGVQAELHVYEGQSHGDYTQGLIRPLPESRDAQSEIRQFFEEHLN